MHNREELMSAFTSANLREVELFRENAKSIHQIVRRNVEGITQEESLIQPRPAGNCLNWVVGHLVNVYDGILPLLGQKPVLGKEILARYGRGTPPLQDPAEAMPLHELLVAWDNASDRFAAGLANLTTEQLDFPAPSSPRNNPDETVRSLLGLVCFHQAYHAGQLGILRRMAGKKGAIA
jgi:uncharacterized damage-inducible protein DinB